MGILANSQREELKIFLDDGAEVDEDAMLAEAIVRESRHLIVKVGKWLTAEEESQRLKSRECAETKRSSDVKVKGIYHMT